MLYNLELTEEEIDFIYDRCSRKAAKLEESHLKDVPCYKLSWQIMSKIYNSKNPKSLPDNTLEVSRLEYEALVLSGKADPNILYLIKEN